MKRTALLHKGEGADAVRAALKEKALELHGKDIEVCRKSVNTEQIFSKTATVF